MTRTTLEPVQVDTDVHEVLPNRTLAELIHRNLRAGRPAGVHEDEKAFARKTQEPLARAFEKRSPTASSRCRRRQARSPAPRTWATSAGTCRWGP